jgi:hypothetical protein
MARLRSALLWLLLTVAASPAATGEGLVVIVPVDRAVELGVAEVAQIYLRQRRLWDDGEPIVPVNRDAESAERHLFTRLVFRGEARRLATYWNRQYFRGLLPPPPWRRTRPSRASSRASARRSATSPRDASTIPCASSYI